ncbi:hypothetical protein ASPWEDRAFT_69285 [Aspergillus wentii DTO 134E9]|uniref:Uncharacterized protein n=1 Tax=Aspergillus wentii DTO 134E9 TaxID=1073089 RepID=A0A1L9RMJ3_ASPWE|nr:uncharacterized protein ASPWEDRAFT_69285 [Aspergillus wentii DTO 134E9]KAI9929500.1 hypothetical protein MW887_000973 [Aspergillus wentii]OJJ36057.1 hypothetical protein ASPWEDRAFT_69285 [Aspergillus wentii DTO 134E9]
MADLLGLGAVSQFPESLQKHSGFVAGANDGSHGQKLLAEESTVEPSVWFVNFVKNQPPQSKDALAEHLQHTREFRSWASANSWANVLHHSNIPMDDSPESIAKRTSFFAAFTAKFIKQSEWHAFYRDDNREHHLNCKSTELHAEIVKHVLKGFVHVPAGVHKSVEGILDSLSNSVKTAVSGSSDKLIVCERFEYVPQMGSFKSYIRLIYFSTNNAPDIVSAKDEETDISCIIRYNNYEAEFAQQKWKMSSEHVDDENLKDDVNKFLGDCEINVHP